MSPMQTLRSLALIQGLPSDACSVEDGTLSSPRLQATLAAAAHRLTVASAEVGREAAHEDSKGEACQAAVPEFLALEQQRLAAALEAQQLRVTTAVAEVQQGFKRAQEQHAGVAAALQALARQLMVLHTEDPAALPLLSTAVNGGVAAGGMQLLQCLASYLAAHVTEQPGPTQSEQQQAEFERLQEAVQLTAMAKVQAQVEVTRAKAELDALQQQQHDSKKGSAGDDVHMLFLGQSVEELEREVQQLQRKLATSLERTQAAAAQVSMQHVAHAIAQQGEAKLKAARRRCAAKQKALDMLLRHTARQQLLAELLRQEHAALGRVHGLLHAALEDGGKVLQATQERLQQLYDRQRQEEAQLDSGLQPAPSSVTGSGGSSEEALASAAEELLKLRASLWQHAGQIQRELLPAHRAVFAQLHGMVFSGSDVSAPVLTAPAVQAKLAVATAAAGSLQQAATAALVDATQRQQQAQRHALKEQVLIDFWTAPENLAKRAEAQRRALQG